MIIKVCGMREPSNIKAVAKLGIDWMGFIFYEKSPRFIPHSAKPLPCLPCKKTGVFVNASLSTILSTVHKHKLDNVQLHGNESPDLCLQLQKKGLGVLKAFSISTKEDLVKTLPYEGTADYFLFDTKSESYGGSGRSFNWKILAFYKGKTPFLISGGIRSNHLESIKNFSHPSWVGIDLNSGFESASAVKDISLLHPFINAIKKL